MRRMGLETEIGVGKYFHQGYKPHFHLLFMGCPVVEVALDVGDFAWFMTTELLLGDRFSVVMTP